MLDERGDLRRHVDGQFARQPNRALFLVDVRVGPEFRLRSYGSLLVADALLTLATHGTAVLAHPGPTDLEPGAEDDVGRLRPDGFMLEPARGTSAPPKRSPTASSN